MRCFAKLFLPAKLLTAVALAFVSLSAPFTTTALALMSREPVIFRPATPQDAETYGSLIGPFASEEGENFVFETVGFALYRMCDQPPGDICPTGIIQSVGGSLDLIVLLNLPREFDILVGPMSPCRDCEFGTNITFKQAGETIHHMHVNEYFVFVE